VSNPSPDLENNLIAVLVETFLLFPSEELGFLSDAVSATRVLPGFHRPPLRYAGIRPDLSAWWVDTDPPHATTPITDERTRNITLAFVSQRFPGLASLCPKRPSDAVTCRICSGATVDRFPTMMCYCGGFGWLPASDRLATPGGNR